MTVDLQTLESIIIKDPQGNVVDRINIEGIELKGKMLVVKEKAE